jgi:fatty acyl-CoA reductase
LTPHLLNGRPNTYTYTKALAEQLILEECKDFPVAVVRPAIVLNSELEPIPGWIDNVNGPAGITVLAGLGILRCINWNYYAIADFVPVDKVVNSLIAIGWSVACEKRLELIIT